MQMSVVIEKTEDAVHIIYERATYQLNKTEYASLESDLLQRFRDCGLDFTEPLSRSETARLLIFAYAFYGTTGTLSQIDSILKTSLDRVIRDRVSHGASD